MEKKQVQLGPLEMDVFGILDGREPMSVAAVAANLADRGQKLAYTTVLTILTRLYKKGLLSREKQGRQFLFKLAHKAEKARKGILSTVYETLFRSDRLRPILNLIDGDDLLTEAELKELKRFVTEKLKRREGGQ